MSAPEVGPEPQLAEWGPCESRGDGRPPCARMPGAVCCVCVRVYVHQHVIVLLYVSQPYLTIVSKVVLYQVPFFFLIN